ncbi:MAG: SMC-Scp complex subunit ScpB [archaeon]
MEDYKNRVEAVLFTTGRFMDLQEIAALCGIGSVGAVKDVLDSLRKGYEDKGSALSIVEENGKWKLNIRKEYNYLTAKLLDTAEMDRPTQETLALIAYRNPAIQSEIVKMRGNTAYDHIKFLTDNQFVTSEKHGRTRLLKLAPKFFDYFDIVEDQLKVKFDSVRPGVVEQKTLDEVSDEKQEEGKSGDSSEAVQV